MGTTVTISDDAAEEDDVTETATAAADEDALNWKNFFSPRAPANGPRNTCADEVDPAIEDAEDFGADDAMLDDENACIYAVPVGCENRAGIVLVIAVR